MTEHRPDEQWLDELLSLAPDPLQDNGFSATVLASLGRQNRKREIILGSIGLVAAGFFTFFIPEHVMAFLAIEHFGDFFHFESSANVNHVIILMFSVFSLLGFTWLFSETV